MVLVNLDAKPFGSCEHCGQLLKEEEMPEGICKDCYDENIEERDL